MLAIRMQRTGRKGHAHFRVVVQDSRQSPKSGKFVALLGSYDPHTKVNSLDKDKAQTYIKNGAQPSERVAALLKKEGVKLPDWVVSPTKKEAKIRNPEKLRRNRPADATPKEEAPAPKAEAKTAEESKTSSDETVVEESQEQVEAETGNPTETTTQEVPVEETPAEDVQPEAELPEPEVKE